MDLKLTGKTALITGASMGIGEHLADVFASEGVNLHLTARSADKLKELKTRIEDAHGVTVTCHLADLTLTGACEALSESVGDIDILVNNAAVFASLDRKPFEDISVDEWDKVMSVNLRGVFLCARAASPIMKAQKYGKIINIASDTMMKGTTHFAHYVSSKGGVVAFSRAIAKEIGKDGICVNSIAPGLTSTDVMEAEEGYTPARFDRSVSARAIPRIQMPEDLAGTVIYLASSDSDFVTGQCIVVNGGDNLY